MTNLNSTYDIDYLKNFSDTKKFCTDKSYIVTQKDHYYSLGIGLSTKCNFQCPMCYYHTDSEQTSTHVDMPLPLLTSILENMPQLSNVTVGLEGEPFCYPHIFQALDIIKNKADNLSLVSNGSLLTKPICDKLTQYPISLFALSIDSADSALYERFRVGGKLDTFKKNGSYLAERLGQVVRLHTVMFTENLDSICIMPKLAAEMSISTISFQQFRPHRAAINRGITTSSSTALEACLEKIIDNALKYNISIYFDSFFGDTSIMQKLRSVAKETHLVQVPTSDKNKCPYLDNFTSILADGRIFPCCGDFQPAPIFEISFDGIFNHSYLQKLRLIIEKSPPPAPCAICKHLSSK